MLQRARVFGVLPRKTVEAGEVFDYPERMNWADLVEAEPETVADTEPETGPADDAPKRRGRPPKSAG